MHANNYEYQTVVGVGQSCSNNVLGVALRGSTVKRHMAKQGQPSLQHRTIRNTGEFGSTQFSNPCSISIPYGAVKSHLISKGSKNYKYTKKTQNNPSLITVEA
jgi:hypothetical protein